MKDIVPALHPLETIVAGSLLLSVSSDADMHALITSSQLKAGCRQDRSTFKARICTCLYTTYVNAYSGVSK